MTTEEKIREAFEKYKAITIYPDSVCEADFKAGYMALLNELEPMYFVDSNIVTYALPEGVTKE